MNDEFTSSLLVIVACTFDIVFGEEGIIKVILYTRNTIEYIEREEKNVFQI